MSINAAPAPNDLSAAYESYVWDGKHGLYGYPGDSFPEFRWMFSLEQRFAWIRQSAGDESGAYLFREMIQWGGSQNGVLQKIEDGASQVCFSQVIRAVIEALPSPEDAIRSALMVPGLGLTYASKLLRFLDPENYGALDSRIRNGLRENHQWVNTGGQAVTIYDGNVTSMTSGYSLYLTDLNQLRVELVAAGVSCPHSTLNGTGQWRVADVELALFQYLGGG